MSSLSSSSRARFRVLTANSYVFFSCHLRRSPATFREPVFGEMASIAVSWNAHACQGLPIVQNFCKIWRSPRGSADPMRACFFTVQAEGQSNCTATLPSLIVRNSGVHETHTQEVQIQSFGRIVVSGLFTAAQGSGRPSSHTGSSDILGHVPNALDPARFLRSLFSDQVVHDPSRLLLT